MPPGFRLLAQEPARPPDAPGLGGEDYTRGVIGLSLVFVLGLLVLGAVLLSRRRPGDGA